VAIGIGCGIVSADYRMDPMSIAAMYIVTVALVVLAVWGGRRLLLRTARRPDDAAAGDRHSTETASPRDGASGS
jgi:hypothetical protein